MKNSIELENLKKLTKSKLVTLSPSNEKNDSFYPSYLKFKGYYDLFFTIEALLNVCILASQTEETFPIMVKNPKEDIYKTLTIIKQLLPFEEGEILDQLHAISKNDKNI